MKKYIAEFIGTMVLVLFGCGTAMLTEVNIVATSLAFGLSIVSMAYVIGNVSGCHVNPAVSLAMLLDKRMSLHDFICYVISQVLGALCGSGLLYVILSKSIITTVNLGANGYGDLSSIGITLGGALLVEIILTFVFVYTILGVTSEKNKAQVAGIVIGLTLTFVHILGIPITGTSVNPARSLAPALIMGGEALKQVWLFIVAPLVGSALATLVYRNLND